MTSYSHPHRALLQSFLSHTTLTLARAKPILAHILSAAEGRPVLANDVTPADLESHVAVINTAIAAYDLEIRSGFTQLGQRRDYGPSSGDGDRDANAGGGGDVVAREKVYALVNLNSDALAQLSTTLSADELAYVTRLLDGIFLTNNAATGRGGPEVVGVSGVEALKLHRPDGTTTTAAAVESQRRRSSLAGAGAPAVKKLTMTEAQNVLDVLVAEGWLEMVAAPPGERGRGWYVPAARLLLELKEWLIRSYNFEEEDDDDDDDDEDDDDDDEGGESGRSRRRRELIKLCKACREIVTSGQRCPDRRCGARLHDACTGAMWRSQRGRKTCPECGTEWSGEGYVGVRALAGAGRSSSGANGQGSGEGAASRGARRRRSAQVDGADDASVEDGDEVMSD